jgi:hypothetical protein
MANQSPCDFPLSMPPLALVCGQKESIACVLYKTRKLVSKGGKVVGYVCMCANDASERNSQAY